MPTDRVKGGPGERRDQVKSLIERDAAVARSRRDDDQPNWGGTTPADKRYRREVREAVAEASQRGPVVSVSPEVAVPEVEGMTPAERRVWEKQHEPTHVRPAGVGHGLSAGTVERLNQAWQGVY